MFRNEYLLADDIKLIRKLRGLTQGELANVLNVGAASVNRWESDITGISNDNIERIYTFAYENNIMLNAIKEQFFREEVNADNKLLFHGSKSGLNGDIRVDRSRFNNDFGQGFYCGESFRQAALFVSNFTDSSVYILSFDLLGLKAAEYKVDREWLLTIACFRGRMRDRMSAEMTSSLMNKAGKADYIIAPIADNRMYQIIESFIDGEITDEQCIHALAATDLGMQYVIKSDKAAKRIKPLERCYVCKAEKTAYTSMRSDALRIADDKVRAARIKYRGKGKYIDELL